MQALSAVLYAIVLLAASLATRAPGAPPPLVPPRRPWAVLVATAVVAVPSVLQLTAAPGLLDALGRRSGEVADGQVWRLVTSLVVQDGGWAGLLFNIAALVYVGLAAERLLGSARWWAVWLVGGLGAQFWAFVVQPVGAGNSVGTFGLAGAVLCLVLLRGRGASRTVAAVGLLAGVCLLVTGDVHGGAVALGAASGVVVHLRTARRVAWKDVPHPNAPGRRQPS